MAEERCQTGAGDAIAASFAACRFLWDGGVEKEADHDIWTTCHWSMEAGFCGGLYAVASSFTSDGLKERPHARCERVAFATPGVSISQLSISLWWRALNEVPTRREQGLRSLKTLKTPFAPCLTPSPWRPEDTLSSETPSYDHCRHPKPKSHSASPVACDRVSMLRKHGKVLARSVSRCHLPAVFRL